MNKRDLIDAISGRLGDKKSATEALNAVLETIQSAVASGDKVAITGFGVFEKISLIVIPESPCLSNWYGDRIAAPVFRSVRRLGLGRFLPWYFASIGLGSKVSTCDGPPFMNR